jgi:sterol desaturase/sphingolipid hydroxylase (fatty acid hydroxylase superfamily)
MQAVGDWSLLQGAWAFLVHFGTTYSKIFFSFGAALSIPSLFVALCVAAICIGYRRTRRTRTNRRLRLRVLIRAFFPRRILLSRSTRADLGFFILNTSVFLALFGWAILSAHTISMLLHGRLTAAFGVMEPTQLSIFATSLVMTFAMFVAYEFGYWLDHYLSHSVPFLWEFHKVHHTAEVLTPVTNFRVHPVDTIVFYNILAILMGATGGILQYMFGRTVLEFSLGDGNVILLVFTYLVGHLQHSHFWIAFTGIWGRMFLSPAHHQIHHSTNPAHFNRNLGNCLGIFDYLFGTLHVPTAKRERLTFGVVSDVANPHTVTEGLIAPVSNALRQLSPKAGETTTQAPVLQ